ncbi:MAG: hypothetical protein QGI36_03525 [Candidatus Thalassarchaeaceae archaeon]|nr:hypothetical protein [Candidatus Thalassarchaeaceae archaeon]
MRGKAVFAVLVTLFLMTPVQAGDVSAQQQSQEDDPRQPNANNTTMYIWADGMNGFWSHFNSNESESTEEGEIREDCEDCTITIKHRYTMDPTLDKRLSMTTGGEVRGNFNIYYAGDADSTDSAGPCQPNSSPNSCDWLNITIYKGQTEVFQHTENPWPSGNWKQIQFSWFIEEGNETWDGLNDNPLIEVTMKITGDYQEGDWGIFAGSGEPAEFAIELGEAGSLLMPIDPASWEEEFQEGGEIGASDDEDTPGFTLVVASAAIAMAAFINQRKEEPEE